LEATEVSLTDPASSSLESEIAIVGMAGRFPGAQDIRAFWRNLRAGVESIVPLSAVELARLGVAPGWIDDPLYIKVAAPLEGVDRFDAEFFGLSPREAAIMDPQHRHFLECTWEALEDAGHIPERFKGSIGVFAGCGMESYFNYHLLTNVELMRSTGLFLVRHTGNDKDFLTTRASYILDLRGPSVGVQTACSTSLVAIHLACQALLSYQCDLALAGGVTIELPQGVGYRFEEGGILSPDGKCRAFDARAQGTVFGSGVGIVALRRAADALADGDHIVAIVKGSAVNNDGARKVGYFAPGVDGQSAAIQEALAVAGVDASSISYIEAHGTGTPLGDAIELAALTDAFRRHTDRTGFCAIGSVKTNIGHLDTAAGVAGVIKTALALRHEMIPASLNFEEPSPRFDLPSTPFVVNAVPRPWPRSSTPRRAAVNSLGVGGTNAHVVLEEAPTRETQATPAHAQVLVLSARTASALDRAAIRLADALELAPEMPLAHAAFTLQAGRRTFAHRRAVVCRNNNEAATRLRDREMGRRTVASRQGRTPPIVMLFPGGGAQYHGMGADLYRDEPIYRERLEECLTVARRLGIAEAAALPIGGLPLDAQASAAVLERPAASILAVFIVEYALAHLWRSWGVEPSAVMGHSAGEYVAAQLAGVFSLEDAMRIVAMRGRIFEQLAPGAMLSVGVSESEAASLLREGIEVAAVNAPGACVVSGEREAMAAFEADLAARDVPFSRLHIDVAAHSRMLDPYLDEFERALSAVAFARPRLPVISNVTGAAAEADIATPGYWRRHLRQPVRFASGVEHVLGSQDQPVLLEVGPGHTLTSLVRSRLGAESARAWAVPSMKHPRESESDHEAIGRALGDLWLAGVSPDWDAVHGVGRRRVSLPGYAFERTRHWIDAALPVWASGHTTASAVPVPREEPAFEGSDWTYGPTWREWSGSGAARGTGSRILVFTQRSDLRGTALARGLEERGATVRCVHPGDAFRVGPKSYDVRPGDVESFRDLFEHCRETHFEPTHLVHAWTWPPEESSRSASLARALPLGFDSLLCLAQTYQGGSAPDVSLTVLTSHGWRVTSEDVSSPEAALVWGPVITAAREFSGLHGRVVDTDGTAALTPIVDVLLATGGVPSLVALREGRLHERLLAPSVPAIRSETPLKRGGVYLITGGLGGIAGVLASRLAHDYRATLVLVGRTQLPPRDEWAAVLRMAPDSAVAGRVRRLRALEAAGARVIYRSADVADLDAVRRVVSDAVEAFGGIDGIFHAAGSVDDGVISLKSIERARRVVMVKAAGAVALDEATKDNPPPVFVLFSSTSAWLGLEGQVDYTSANAYLDAFAEWRSHTRSGRTLSVGWGTWRDVGMASRALGLEAESREPVGTESAGHPLLGALIVDEPGHLTFEAMFKVGDRWELHEHRLASGQAVLPGAAFVDMLWAAATRAIGSSVIELDDIVFEAPFMADEQVSYLLRTTLRRQGESWSAHIDSTVAGEDGVRRTQHVRATIVKGKLPTSVSPVALGAAERIDAGFDPLTGLNPRQAEHVRFGGRWHVLQQATRTDGSMVARLSLPPDFDTDLSVPRIHPALFDIATTIAIPLLEEVSGECVFVPFSYGRLLLAGPLPAELHVWASPAASLSGATGTASFDVTGVDAAGNVVLDARDFVMRLVPVSAFTSITPSRIEESPELARLRGWVARGIPSSVGIDLLFRLIGSESSPGVVVTSIPYEELSASIQGPPAERQARTGPPSSRERAAVVVAELWRDLLGVQTVRPDDDFFNLGGHSLVAVRFVSRLERELGVRLSLSALFDARTPKAIAEMVTRVTTPRWTSLVAVQSDGTRPPFYCVHPLGGEVLGYRRLAAAIGSDQPFWGFRSRGHEGEFEPIDTIEGQAALYIADLLAKDPEGPYYIGGYSHGGRVAFEMSRQLHAQGKRVALLAIIDTWPKQGTFQGLDQVGAWIRNVPGWLRHELAKNELWRSRRELSRTLTRLRRMATDALEGRAARPDIAEEMDVEHLPEHIRRTIQANFAAFTSYVPGPYEGSAVLLRATAQPLASPATRDLGWGVYVKGELRVREFRGTHRMLTKDPLVRTLGKVLREELDRARAPVEGAVAAPPDR
jgi:acyl transferase domain-containing protein/thioesterase domain-containing protein/acyl carrier protein